MTDERVRAVPFLTCAVALLLVGCRPALAPPSLELHHVGLNVVEPRGLGRRGGRRCGRAASRARSPGCRPSPARCT